MKKIFNLSFMLLFFASLPLFAQVNTKTTLQKEYESLLMRLKFSNTPGFCYDGISKIAEEKVQGDEHSFFTEEKNIYVKVIDTANNKSYFTRSFDFTDVLGYLGIGKYRLEQAIKLDGDHWNFFKLDKKVNITVCSAKTCTNTVIQLYEITEDPETAVDGVFYTFKKGSEKKVDTLKFSLRAKSKPSINLETEEKKALELLEKIKNHFTQAEIALMKSEIEKALSLAKQQ